ncbi:MAG: ABC transporter permease [Candidatus Bathyarchaeia archaeon]
MVSIARRNLLHEKGRFTATAIGIAASIMLVLFGVGMSMGIWDSMVTVVDHSNADIWVMNSQNVDLVQGQSILPQNMLTQIAGINGVKTVIPLIYSSSIAEKAGAKQTVEIVGVDGSNALVAPWSLISGNAFDLSKNGSVIVDQSVQLGLGKLSVGDKITINNSSEEVVGICNGAKTFFYPFIFTLNQNAQKLCGINSNETNYILVSVQKAQDTAQIAKQISQVIGVNALPKAEVRTNTVNYMLYKSGIGMMVGVFAGVGLFVAVTIVSLTIYTATMERLPEYGTLKALGAAKKDIYRILIEQAFWPSSVGFIAGLGLSLTATLVITSVSIMPIEITLQLVVAVYGMTVLLSILGAFLSIRKVGKIDPAIVFRT